MRSSLERESHSETNAGRGLSGNRGKWRNEWAATRAFLSMQVLSVGRRLPAGPRTHQAIGTSDHQNDTVVVSVTSRGSPTAMIRLLLLDG